MISSNLPDTSKQMLPSLEEWDHPDLPNSTKHLPENNTVRPGLLLVTPSSDALSHTLGPDRRWTLLLWLWNKCFSMTVSDILLYYLMFAFAHLCCTSPSSSWWLSKIRKSIVGCVVWPVTLVASCVWLGYCSPSPLSQTKHKRSTLTSKLELHVSGFYLWMNPTTDQTRSLYFK